MSATFRRAPRAIAFALAIAVLLPTLAAQSAAALAAGASGSVSGRGKAIGSIEYLRGSIAIVRDGEALPEPGPGDLVYNGDLVRTDASSSASIAMDPSSGFTGSIAISPGSALYLNRSMQGQAKTKLDLMAGSLSAKVTKIAGTPSLDVATGSSTFGVRGTEFQIALSLNDSLLAVCLEGKVAVTSGENFTALPAGQAI